MTKKISKLLVLALTVHFISIIPFWVWIIGILTLYSMYLIHLDQRHFYDDYSNLEYPIEDRCLMVLLGILFPGGIVYMLVEHSEYILKDIQNLSKTIFHGKVLKFRSPFTLE